MATPGDPRPVPGPPRAPAPLPGSDLPEVPPADPAAAYSRLADLPVAEHVAIFEAEHGRLRQQLSIIDRL